MKFILISILTILSITGCQDSSTRNGVAMMNDHRSGVNRNSLAYVAGDKNAERKNKLEISKLNSDAKIEIAKIESGNKLEIAKINAETKKEVAHTDSTTKIKTTQIDSLTKKDDMKNTLYISIAIIFSIVIALFLLYFNNKKNRELKTKLHQDQLQHELHIKEREHDERRLHKMLELVEKGKLSPEMQEEVIVSLTKPKLETVTLIESK